jgi:hypothetical protein
MNFNLEKAPKDIAVEDQNLEVEFAHCRKINGDWTNVSHFSVCRDFLGDTIYATEIDIPISIYGFKYDPKKNPLNKTNCSIGIKFPNMDTMQYFIQNYPRLFTMGTIFCPKTVDIFPQEQIIVLTFNKLWAKSTFAISYLSYILKCLCYKLDPNKNLLDQIETMKYHRYNSWNGTTDTLSIKEADYLKNTKDLIAKLPKVITKLLKKLPNSHGTGENTNMYTVHNNSGFYSTLRWKRNETWKLAEELLK